MEFSGVRSRSVESGTNFGTKFPRQPVEHSPPQAGQARSSCPRTIWTYSNIGSIRATCDATCMSRPNSRTVTPAGDDWTVDKPGASRASSRHDTQAEAIAARGYLQNEGGGELKIKGTDGKVRAQDTIPKGNDPTRSPG